MNIDSIIKRARKRIHELESRKKASSVFQSFDGKFPENFSGLVVCHGPDFKKNFQAKNPEPNI